MGIGKGNFRLWFVASIAWIIGSCAVLIADGQFTPELRKVEGDAGLAPYWHQAMSAAFNMCDGIRGQEPIDPRRTFVYGKPVTPEAIQAYEAERQKYEDGRVQREGLVQNCFNEQYGIQSATLDQMRSAEIKERALKGAAIMFLPPALIAAAIMLGLWVTRWVRAGYNDDRQA